MLRAPTSLCHCSAKPCLTLRLAGDGADDAADEFHRELASVVAWLVDDVKAETTDRLSTLLSQLLIKFASRQQISAAEGGRPTWDSFLHSAVHLMAGRNCYRASVMLAHSLRQAAALGGPEVAQCRSPYPRPFGYTMLLAIQH
jgi:hypothetical protein